MIRLKRCLKSEKKQKQIENVPNSVNPNFYRRCHLEMARQFTLKSQGGYIGAFHVNLWISILFTSSIQECVISSKLFCRGNKVKFSSKKSVLVWSKTFLSFFLMIYMANYSKTGQYVYEL